MKALFKAMMSWTTAVEGMAVASIDSDLRAGLGFVVGGQGTWALGPVRVVVALMKVVCALYH